jgi:hypothetical protein
VVVGTPSNLVLALLTEFAGDLRGTRTINQLARSSGKAYANTHATAQMLLRDSILLKEVVGHSHQCRLNLTNDKTLLYLSLLEMHKRDELLRTDPDVRTLLARIDMYGPGIGILLAWYRADGPDHLLLVTSHTPTNTFSKSATTAAGQVHELLGMQCAILPLAAFLQDTTLRTTISSGATLLVGHALYASLLREVAR